MGFFEEYDFSITYHLEKTNMIANVLSWKTTTCAALLMLNGRCSKASYHESLRTDWLLTSFNCVRDVNVNSTNVDE